MAAGRIAAKDWLQPARTVQPRPPMPWFVLREMVGADLKAIDACGRAAGHVARFPG